LSNPPSRDVEHAGEQAFARLVVEQPATKFTKHVVIEPLVGQIEAEQVFPVDPRPCRLGRLTVAQGLAELQQRDQGQAPGRIRRLSPSRVEIGEVRVLEHNAEPVA
jgi:hypothetical protein